MTIITVSCTGHQGAGKCLISGVLLNLRLLLFLTMFLFMVGCKNENQCDYREMVRIASPDNKVEAVLLRINCGATTSYSYKVFITPKGKPVEKSQPIFVADHLEGEIIKWNGPKQLEIMYKQARIFNFTNFWQTHEIDNFKYIVSIYEKPVSDKITDQ